jgi:hypothetical protein
MIISYDGTDYDFDSDRISVDEWRELKRKYKMTPKAFQEGLSEADPDAMTFLYLSMLRQAGRVNVTLGDHLKPDIIALNRAVAEAQEAEGEQEDAEPEPDPTKASPSPAPSPEPSPPPATLSPEEMEARQPTGF